LTAWTKCPGGVRIQLLVQPRASRTEVVGLYGEALKIRVAAPPVDGAANEAIIRFFADRLDVSRSRVHLTKGASGRRKVVEIDGIGLEALIGAFAAEES
jgi:uncharacterized protein (TIGR00251 family)